MNNQELLVVVTGPTGPAVSQNQDEILLSASIVETEVPTNLKPLRLKIS